MTANDKHYPKPVYVVAGASELAVDRIRKLPGAATKLRDRVQVELQRIDLADVRGRVQNEVVELPTKVRSELDVISDRVKVEVRQLRGRFEHARRKGVAEARTDAEKFRSNAQHAVNDIVETAQRQFEVATRQVAELYEGLASRGARALGEDQPAKATTGVPAPKAVAGETSVAKTATGGKATARKTPNGKATGNKADRTP